MTKMFFSKFAIHKTLKCIKKTFRIAYKLVVRNVFFK